MSTVQPHRMKICHFDIAFGPSQYYICYQNETCCKEGCCPNFGHNYFQTWYFWIAIILFFLAYRCACWYCKKLVVNRSDEIMAPPTRRRNGEQVNNLLDQLIVSYSNRYLVSDLVTLNTPIPKPSTEPPPQYSIAVNLPNPSTPRNSNQEIPTYEQATSPQ